MKKSFRWWRGFRNYLVVLSDGPLRWGMTSNIEAAGGWKNAHADV